MTDLNQVEVLIPSQPPSSIWTWQYHAICEECYDEDADEPTIKGAYLPNCYKRFILQDDYDFGLCKKHLESCKWLDERAVLRFFTGESNGYPEKCVHCGSLDIEQTEHEWGEHWINVRFRCHGCFEDMEVQAEFNTWKIL